MIPAALSCSNYRLGYSQSAPLRRSAQCSGDHSVIICSLRSPPLRRKHFARRINCWFEFCWPDHRERCKVSPAQRSVLMGMPVNTPRAWRFGVFELDASSGELRRNGTVIKLREQPARILLLLLEHAGQMVTREQLRQHLWPSDTFVDFDHSRNAAVMKLREALGDSADKPLYIETIPKKGYRFVAPVSLGLAMETRNGPPGRPSPALADLEETPAGANGEEVGSHAA